MTRAQTDRAQTVHLHRPKVEYFDVADLTNIDPKGFVRAVERYHVEPWGLYMARPADHVEFHYLESWLLPALGLRATVFHYNPGYTRRQDYYLDIGEFGEVEPGRWRSIDHYLDIVVRNDHDARLLDIDELLAAHAAGYLDLAAAQQAVTVATATIDGLARHGHNFDRWLTSLDIELTWVRS
ncbi:DUF402 domain-containing protein [Nocardia sp. CDC159]|uniref:DUF402 domain-containing protein n=1 Tax=Nocardia pulmonis TaxID=2951408 RepID=A0A9X2EIN3_9NOCA|nr:MULTISPECIES: DUF402 domain-containing protein [Nocardia]MCM6778801.1 DUF402 domain-containing protein [Nocardia pulmonis]MCM6791690.1 DUF402 domain-containing protein [Nocardia sp. CDC159]